MCDLETFGVLIADNFDTMPVEDRMFRLECLMANIAKQVNEMHAQQMELKAIIERNKGSKNPLISKLFGG